MSIFTKDCPVCAASHAVHVVRCGCGYCFDPNKLDGVTQELEVISQEEQLYRDYLAARAAQADQAMQAAKIAAARERANTVKAAEALLAEQTAMSARAELDAQDQRAKAVKNRIKVVRAGRRARRVAKAASAPRPAPVSVRQALAPKPTLAAPPPIATPLPTPVAAPVAAPIKPLPLPPKVIAPKPVMPKPAIPKPMVVAAPAPVPVVVPAPVVAKQPTPVSPPRQAPRPAPATVIPPPVPTLLDKPTPTFRANQADKAAQLTPAPAKSNSLDCPNCSAKVSASAKRCRCGFEMPLSASQIPSLSMSAEDRAAFLAALAPVGNDPNR